VARRRFSYLCAAASAVTIIVLGTPASAQSERPPGRPPNMASDPGVRVGPPGAGGPLPGLSTPEVNFFTNALTVFREVDSVSGTIEAGSGLGPRFNLDSCAGCHAQPVTGGTSPTVNPQVAVATKDGAQNVVPSFVRPNGPVREARFVANPDGTPDGGVHDLFVITGRADASGCNIAQPDFANQLRNNNVIFRIPTPVFGLGLVEAVPDGGLQAAQAANAQLMSSLGITSGAFNRNGNDGTITRFGWKAQNKSLLVFAGEAYNVEQGVTNELFPNEREGNPSCQFNGTPEDPTKLAVVEPTSSPASDFSADVVNFAAFMRLSAPAMPATSSDPTVTRGQQVFMNIGCQGCHVVAQTTGKSTMTGQSNLKFQPYSDFALHRMGALADRVAQGAAGGDQFRTAPLWGVGQRIFFLHDGRTNDLVDAIEAHSSSGSEANSVVANFNSLSKQDKQGLLTFLRSL
jgi:CxxC motif-containing protein (DUF1111 family)